MENKTDIIFPDGMSFFQPHHNSPDYVKGDISIHPVKFINFLKANREHMSAKGFFKLNLMESKNGNWYLKLDTWKPGTEAPKHDRTPQPDKTYAPAFTPPGGYPSDINPEDVPF